MFAYREVAPSRALAPYVKCFWLLRAESEAPPTERIIPDGSFEMVFHFGDPFGGQPSAMVVGEIRRPVLLRPSRHAENLEHEFPQRIIYWRDGARLCARAEGTIQGKAEGEESCWRRAR